MGLGQLTLSREMVRPEPGSDKEWKVWGRKGKVSRAPANAKLVARIDRHLGWPGRSSRKTAPV